MKKTLSTLLVVTLVVGCLFALSGCSMIQDPMASENTRLHSDDCLSFEYPASWFRIPFGVDMVMDSEGTGNNINISYDTDGNNEFYDDLDVEKFDEALKPSFEAAGMEISNVVIEKGTTNGLEYVLLSYDSVMSGTNMHMTQIVTFVNDRTYILTVTEVTPDPDLVETVLSTLSAK